MNKGYWDDRRTAARASARLAASPEARAIHEELARRYGVEAERGEAVAPAADRAGGEDQRSAPALPGAAFAPLPIRPARFQPSRPGRR